MLERSAGGPLGRHREHATAAGTVRVRCGKLAGAPAVVVASEPLDENPDWRLMASGELLHVGADLHVDGRVAMGAVPTHLLTRAELSPRAAASQHPATPEQAA